MKIVFIFLLTVFVFVSNVSGEEYSREYLSEAALAVSRVTGFPASRLMGLVGKESTFGLNPGTPGWGIDRALTVEDALGLLWFSDDAFSVKGSFRGAVYLMQVRIKYWLYYMGARVIIRDVPRCLLWGYDNSLSIEKDKELVRYLQAGIGVPPDEVDGLWGYKSVAAAKKFLGSNRFGKRERVQLILAFFADQVTLRVDRTRDRIFYLVCRVHGWDPVRTEYFLPNPSDPVDAFCFAVLYHSEEMVATGKGLDFATRTYNQGRSNALRGRGKKYLAEVEKFERNFFHLNNAGGL